MRSFTFEMITNVKEGSPNFFKFVKYTLNQRSVIIELTIFISIFISIELAIWEDCL